MGGLCLRCEVNGCEVMLQTIALGRFSALGGAFLGNLVTYGRLGQQGGRFRGAAFEIEGMQRGIVISLCGPTPTIGWVRAPTDRLIAQPTN